MSSPFAIFRKHQRQMMAVLVVVAMFCFAFLDSLTGVRSGGGGLLGMLGLGHNDVAVRYRGGHLTHSDIGFLVQQRQRANEFLGQMFQAVMSEKDLKPEEQQALRTLQQTEGFGFGAPGGIEQDVVLGELLRLEGQRLGITISDQAIENYISYVTINRLTSAQFQAILKTLGMPPRVVYDYLRQEMIAKRAHILLNPRLDVTPEQYWRNYQKMKVEQELEVAALPVKEFVAEIGDPPKHDLEKFFNDNRLRFANQGPDYARAGFRQPKKVAIQYLSVAYEEIEKSIPEIKDDEIQNYYDEHKESLYLIKDIPTDSVHGTENPVKPEFAPDTGDGSKPAPPALPEDPDTPAKSEDKPAEKPADQPEEKPEAKAEEKPADKPESKPEDKPAEDKPKDPGTACAEPVASSAAAVTIFQEQAEKKPDEEKKADAPNTEEKKAEEKPAAATANKPASVPVPAEKPAEKPTEKSDTDKPAAKPGLPAPEKPVVAPAGEKPAETPEKNPETPAPKKYKPLDETLKENIQEELLRERTNKAIRELIQKAADRMTDMGITYNAPASIEGHHIAYVDLNENQKRDDGEPFTESKKRLTEHEISLPKEVTQALDKERAKLAAKEMTALAKELGLKFGSTELLTARELSENPSLGKIVAADANEFNQDRLRAIFDELFSSNDNLLYRAIQGKDEEGNQYAYWKVDNIESHIPKFGDPGIADEVLKAWKLKEAYTLAQKRAEELAKLAGAKAGVEMKLSLEKETVNGKKDGLPLKVLETGAFSWMSRSSVQSPNPFAKAPPIITQVPFVENPGDEFMQAACEGIPAGSTGFAPNAEHSYVYVIRVMKRTPSGAELDNLRQAFLKDGGSPGGPLFGMEFFGFSMPSDFDHMAGYDELKLRIEWLEALQKRYNVKWTDESKQFD